MRYAGTEQKQLQSKKIRNWKPWLKSTGAKTPEGKARSSKNALKHGLRSREARAAELELTQQLKEMKEVLTQLNSATQELNEQELAIALDKLSNLSLMMDKIF